MHSGDSLRSLHRFQSGKSEYSKHGWWRRMRHSRLVPRYSLLTYLVHRATYLRLACRLHLLLDLCPLPSLRRLLQPHGRLLQCSPPSRSTALDLRAQHARHEAVLLVSSRTCLKSSLLRLKQALYWNINLYMVFVCLALLKYNLALGLCCVNLLLP